MRSTLLTSNLYLALVFTFLFGFGPLFGQLTVINGDFEAWPSGCPYNTAPNNWTNYSTSLGPDQSGTCAGTLTSHSGSSHMNLVWIDSGLEEGAVQNVGGLTAGVTYRISFWGANNQGLYSAGGDCIIEIHRNSTPIFATPNLVSGGPWTEYSVEFTASASTETLGVRVKQGNSGTSGSAAVDDFSVSNAVSIHDALFQAFSISPNPAASSLRVSYAGSESANCRVLSVMGAEVLPPVSLMASTGTDLDISTLSPGIYLLEMTAGSQRAVRKFIKE